MVSCPPGDFLINGLQYSIISYLPSSTIATDSVIDLVLLSSDDGLVAMAGCHDNSLRLFSHKVRTERFYTKFTLMVTIATESDIDLSIIRVHRW